MNNADASSSIFSSKSSSQSSELCTRCGRKNLLDITHYEFPQQKGLLFECMSCGNSSLRSNVSDDERQRRFAFIAANHLSTIDCQWCEKRFHIQEDYLIHVQTAHQPSSSRAEKSN